MRIVSGSLRGRPLSAPQDQHTRPTSDRVRESIFNIIAHHADAPPLEGARIIDLFAGTGALGLEALSRGASWCLFVDNSAASRALIRTNIDTLELHGRTKLFRRDATSLGPAGNLAGFSYAFLDPPYAKGLAERALIELHEGAWLSPSAFVVIEEHSKSEIELPQGYTRLDQRSYGDTQVLFAHYTSRPIRVDGADQQPLQDRSESTG